MSPHLFDQFCEQTLKESKELGIEDPKLKRKEKIPKKKANFIHQDEPEKFAYTVEEHYEAIFLKSFYLALVYFYGGRGLGWWQGCIRRGNRCDQGCTQILGTTSKQMFLIPVSSKK